MRRLKCAVLGATGMVGQRFVRMLEGHEFFELSALAASGKNAGREYGQACNWLISDSVPEYAKGMELENVESVSSIASKAEVIFSALPSDVASKVEFEYAKQCFVFSKASAFRMEEDVPLLVPEINAAHASPEIFESQRKKRGLESGFLTTDPNCSTVQLALALAPLQQFGIASVIASTYQALSGAGYPGVASLDAMANVIPFIEGEEEKMAEESKKIFSNPEWGVTASCVRVPVREGHLESVFVETDATVEQAIQAWESFKGEPQEMRLPTAPEKPVIVTQSANRPQPLLDVDNGNGMSITIGRARRWDKGLAFFVLGHNTVRGAAGNALLNAELFMKKGMLA